MNPLCTTHQICQTFRVVGGLHLHMASIYNQSIANLLTIKQPTNNESIPDLRRLDLSRSGHRSSCKSMNELCRLCLGQRLHDGLAPQLKVPQDHIAKQRALALCKLIHDGPLERIGLDDIAVVIAGTQRATLCFDTNAPGSKPPSAESYTTEHRRASWLAAAIAYSRIQVRCNTAPTRESDSGSTPRSAAATRSLDSRIRRQSQTKCPRATGTPCRSCTSWD